MADRRRLGTKGKQDIYIKEWGAKSKIIWLYHNIPAVKYKGK